jgi:hypothetical protein
VYALWLESSNRCQRSEVLCKPGILVKLRDDEGFLAERLQVHLPTRKRMATRYRQQHRLPVDDQCGNTFGIHVAWPKEADIDRSVLQGGQLLRRFHLIHSDLNVRTTSSQHFK